MNKKLFACMAIASVFSLGCLSAVACNTKNNEPETPEHTHTADSVWQNDENKHWHNCTANDDYKFNEGSHVYDNDQDTDCNTCGYERQVTQITVTINGESTVTAGSSITLTAIVTPGSVTDPVTWAIVEGSTLATIDAATGYLPQATPPAP